MKKIVLAVTVLILAASGWVWFELSAIPSMLKGGINPAEKLVINNVNVISMAPEQPMISRHQTVEIERGKITAIYAATDDRAGVEGATVIDGEGQFLLPGLIDAHVHVSDEAELAGYLAYGVTGIRNMSGYPFHIPLQQQINSRTLLGPDFRTTGPILNSPGPNANLIQQMVSTDAEARAAVQQQYDAGFDAVKVYSNLNQESFDSIVDQAQKLGMRVSGHSPEGERLPGIPRDKPFTIAWQASLDKGFETLEHTETLIWHGLRDDLDEQKLKQLAQQIVDSGNTLVPTLIAHKRLVNIAQSKGEYLQRPENDMVNPFVRWVEKGSTDYWSHLDPSGYEAPHSEFFIKATGKLHEYGVTLLVGTDAGGFGLVPGASIHEELALMSEAGILPYDVLKAATYTNAKVLGFEQAGQVAVGFDANLVLVDQNPLLDISAMQSINGLAVHGQWLDKEHVNDLKDEARDTSMTRSIVRALELLWFIR